MRSLNHLAWRSLAQHRLRSLLSALAVALGVSTVVAADLVGAAIRNAGQTLEGSQGTVTFAGDFLNSGLRLMGLAILAAAGLLVFNAFAMGITQRRERIGALRALGLTRRQVLQLVWVEALLLGAGGSLLGLLVGPLWGRAILLLLTRWTGIAHGAAPLRPFSLLGAAALGLGLTLVATLFPAWRATRVPPLAVLRAARVLKPAAGVRRPALLGLLLILSLFAYLLLRPPARSVLTPPWDFVLVGAFAGGCLAGLLLLLPWLLETTSRLVRRPARRSAALRLSADNLGRARGRVVLTVATLATALLAIVAVTGISTFTFEIVITQIASRYDMDWVVMPFEIAEGGPIVDWEILSKWDLSTARIPVEFVADLDRLTAGRARLVHVPEVVVPEIAIMSGMPSFVADPEELSQSGLFTFSAGGWSSARPLMEAGCALLLTPRMARQNGVGLYDTLVLQGVDGPVDCTVAGLGTSSFMGTSIISRAAGDAFGLRPDQLFAIIVLPLPGVDREGLQADLRDLIDRQGGVSLIEVEPFFQDVAAVVDRLQALLNGMLLLAILAAAAGVLNTTLIAVHERRRELGLLRALGATRRQLWAVVVGEAAWMGLLGGLLGLLAGLGLTAIFVLVQGGHMYGLQDLALGPAIGQSLGPALGSGLLGLLAAPLVSAAAAGLAVRATLRREITALLSLAEA
ncbi:MAG: ABC transporter permease [Chloroflexia bacterium]|nr:ABC transporter permease [Chloroflexia bacterium]